MKLATLILASLFVAQAYAKDVDPRPAVTVTKQDNAVTLKLTGAAAQALYDALEVNVQSQFGFVQKFVKTTANIQCSRAIMGDIPGQMSSPRYQCDVIENVK